MIQIVLTAEVYLVFVVRYRRQTEEIFRSPPSLTPADGLCHETSVEGLRLCGSENKKEGFIRMYNTTINAWSMLCDPQFNDRTAEVNSSMS